MVVILERVTPPYFVQAAASTSTRLFQATKGTKTSLTLDHLQ